MSIRSQFSFKILYCITYIKIIRQLHTKQYNIFPIHGLKNVSTCSRQQFT